MDPVRLGSAFRAARLHLGLPQRDLAERAGLHRTTIGRIEHGRLEGVTLGTLERVGRVLEIRLDLNARWRGGELARLIDAGHARLHELVARRLQATGWEVAPEASFSVFGERGAIDILAWHAPSRSLLVIELKTVLVEVGALMGGLDRKRRLAPTVAAERGWRPLRVGTWVVLTDTRTNRRRVAAVAAALRAAFPDDGRTMRRWLRHPDRPISALGFLTDEHVDSRSRTTFRVRPARERGGPRSSCQMSAGGDRWQADGWLRTR